MKPASPGILFVPTGDMHLSHNSWILSLTVSLSPYSGNIGKLRNEVQNFVHLLSGLPKSTTNGTLSDQLQQLLTTVLVQEVTQFHLGGPLM